MARLDLLQELIASTNWTLEVEPLRLRNVTFSYMQLRSLDMRDVKDKYIVLDMSTADALATVLKQVGRLDLSIKLNEDLSEWITLNGGITPVAEFSSWEILIGCPKAPYVPTH